MKVILVRHAETEWNVKGIIQGQSDSTVTHRGLQETSALLTALAESDYQIDSVYASPLGRAWHMGHRLAKSFSCPLVAEPALKEQAFGQFERMTLARLRENHPNEAHALFRLDAQYCPPGGESLAQASQRVLRLLHLLEGKRQHQTVCLVSHGHVIQGVLAILNEGAINDFPRYAHPNASYSVFDLIKGQCIGVRWGIATHLRHLKQ